MNNEKVTLWLGKIGVKAEGNCAYIVAGAISIAIITTAIVIAKKPDLITKGIAASKNLSPV